MNESEWNIPTFSQSYLGQFTSPNHAPSETSYFLTCPTISKWVWGRNLSELYTNSVFSVGIWSVFLRYYITNTIPKVWNSVGTFRYRKGGSAPLFPQKGGNGPLFESSNPLLEKRGEERGEVYKKGGTIPTEIPKIQQIWYQQNTNTKKTAGNTVVSPYRRTAEFSAVPAFTH